MWPRAVSIGSGGWPARRFARPGGCGSRLRAARTTPFVRNTASAGTWLRRFASGADATMTRRSRPSSTRSVDSSRGSCATRCTASRSHSSSRDQPTAFALPGGFIFVARPLVALCERDRDELAFVIAHEMAHVIRRHAIDRLLRQKVLSAASMAAPGRGALGSWVRKVGLEWLERAHSQDDELEADALGVRLTRGLRFRQRRRGPSPRAFPETRAGGRAAWRRAVSVDPSSGRRSGLPACARRCRPEWVAPVRVDRMRERNRFGGPRSW